MATIRAELADAVPAGGFDVPSLEALKRTPAKPVSGIFTGIPYTASIAIAGYGRRIEAQYRDVAPGGLQAACTVAGIPFALDTFGLAIHFDRPAEIAVHDDAMRLADSIRALVDRFGPVILRNAVMESTTRQRFHRNIFPHLRFHVDRGATMPNQYSCFTRDPADAEQRRPRESSTLFIANIVAWLESVRAGEAVAGRDRGARPSYDLFGRINVAPLLGETILEQPWSEPECTGEIVICDNRTVLHATWHKDGRNRGYPIGARYLA